MASDSTIRRCLRLLSGAYPRGGYSFGGELKQDAVMAWSHVFGDDHVQDQMLRDVIGNSLALERAPRPHDILALLTGAKRTSVEGRAERGCSDCDQTGLRTVYAVMREERGQAERLEDRRYLDRWHTEAVRCTCDLGRVMFGGKGPDVDAAQHHYSGLLLAKGVQMDGCAWFAISPHLNHHTMMKYRDEVRQRRAQALGLPNRAPHLLEPDPTEPHELDHHAARLQQHEGLEGEELAVRLSAERERLRQRTLHRAGDPL